MASEDCFQMARDGDLEGWKAARQNGCPWDEKGIQYQLQNPSHQLHNFYGPRRWLERELNIVWSSSIVQWMDATDTVLDAMLISDLSSLIKKYV